MRILFLGGDQRQLSIVNELSTRHSIDVVGYKLAELEDKIKKIDIENLNISLYDVIIFPVNGVQDNYVLKTSFENEPIHLDLSLLSTSKSNALIFTGIRTKWLDDILKSSNKECIALMEENDVKKQNSIPTVEGIIGDLVYNTPNTINQANILVLGYGNIGKLLVEKLKSLGANVVVGVMEENDFEYLKEQDISAFFTADQQSFSVAVKQSQIIINTVPSLMLNKELLDAVEKETYILDVASAPHGVDKDYAIERGLNHKLSLGIPSIVAPKTAGLILSKKINQMIGGKK
jgi:dipicolinate synthase subunit A